MQRVEVLETWYVEVQVRVGGKKDSGERLGKLEALCPCSSLCTVIDTLDSVRWYSLIQYRINKNECCGTPRIKMLLSHAAPVPASLVQLMRRLFPSPFPPLRDHCVRCAYASCRRGEWTRSRIARRWSSPSTIRSSWCSWSDPWVWDTRAWRAGIEHSYSLRHRWSISALRTLS